jgi:hypothetical protein
LEVYSVFVRKLLTPIKKKKKKNKNVRSGDVTWATGNIRVNVLELVRFAISMFFRIFKTYFQTHWFFIPFFEQPISSDASAQSLTLSHFDIIDTHSWLPHWKNELISRCPGKERNTLPFWCNGCSRIFW